MKPNQLSKLLFQSISACMPVLIKGAPGIGKTDIVTKACMDAGAELIISHPVVDEPIDYKGLPYIKDGHAEFLPFGSLHRLIEAKQPTVYFMDDLGQAAGAVQAAAMQLLLARRINGHRVSELVTFLAATNRKQDKAGVSGILEPVKSRFATIVELEPDIDDWVDWATIHCLPPELVAFIRFRPNLLFDFAPSVDITNSPCPRTVHNVAKLMALALPAEVEFEAYSGAAGEGFAAELLGFLQIYRSLPDSKLILLDPQGATVPTDPATLYAVCGALARLAEPSSMGPLVTYANRLPDEFSVLLITDCERQNPLIVNTRAYAMWTARHHAVQAFVADYHSVIFEAKKTLGDLFCRDDYPDASEIDSKFEFRTVISPVPTAEDFRVNLAHDEIAAVQQDLEKRLKKSHAAATRDLWQRLYEVMEHMTLRLADPDSVFRDSLVKNIVHLISLLPRLNLNDDPDLKAMRRQIEASLCQYTLSELRKDKQIRREAADAARSVLASMGSYMREAA